MKKYPTKLQDADVSNGICCIAMLLEYYGFLEEINHIKKNVPSSKTEMTLEGIVECLKNYQIEAEVCKITLEHIKSEIIYPCILLLKGTKESFVVLYDITKEGYIVGDPTQGLIIMSKKKIKSIYTQSAISIHHIGRITQTSYKSYKQFLKEVILSHTKDILGILQNSFFVACMIGLGGYCLKIIIDCITVNTEVFFIVLMSLACGIIGIIKISLENARNIKIKHIQRIFDEKYVFCSSWNMYTMPLSLFNKDSALKQGQLLSFFELSKVSLYFLELLFFDGTSFFLFLIGMIFVNLSMTILMICMIICLCFYMYKSLSKTQNINKDSIETNYVYHHHLLELINNQFIIRRFDLYQKERERSFDIFFKRTQAKEQYDLLMYRMKYKVTLMIIIFDIMILITGFLLFKQEIITLGSLGLFCFLMYFSLKSITNIMFNLNKQKQMSFVYEKFKTFTRIKEQNKTKLKRKIEKITLDNVSYSYGFKEPVFEHLDYIFHKNIIIQGYVGTGKSTLLNLLMGTDHYYKGDIYYNDQELRTIEMRSLYKHIGYECESPSFLCCTLYENFLCEDKELIKKYLCLFKQPQLIGLFDIEIDQKGNPLSLGQRQIVALIRLLLQQYDVYILDEALSHIDIGLVRKIMEYLFSEVDDAFFIVVSQQIKRVKKNCDYVIINEGKLKVKEGKK